MKNAKTAEKTATTKTKAEPKKATAEQKKEAKEQVSQILKADAQSRIKKAEQFTLLASKYKTLNAKKDELDSFIISSDQTNERIFLENAKGMKFVVSNSQVVEKVIDMITDQLELFIKKSEKEIEDFII